MVLLPLMFGAQGWLSFLIGLAPAQRGDGNALAGVKGHREVKVAVEKAKPFSA